MKEHRAVKLTPANPCCDECVLAALKRAGFDYKDPFVVVSNLGDRPSRARSALLDELIGSGGAAILLVSAPVSVEKPEDEVDEEKPATDDNEPLDEQAMRDVLGIDGSGVQ